MRWSIGLGTTEDGRLSVSVPCSLAFVLVSQCKRCLADTDMFCTHYEFRQMFNHSLLDKMRTRLRCRDAFPLPYTKMKPEAGIVDLSEEEEAERKEGLFIQS